MHCILLFEWYRTIKIVLLRKVDEVWVHTSPHSYCDTHSIVEENLSRMKDRAAIVREMNWWTTHVVVFHSKYIWSIDRSRWIVRVRIVLSRDLITASTLKRRHRRSVGVGGGFSNKPAGSIWFSDDEFGFAVILIASDPQFDWHGDSQHSRRSRDHSYLNKDECITEQNPIVHSHK